MGTLSFRTTLLGRGNACAIVLTDEQAAQVGEGAKRFPVVATLGGQEFRIAVGRMGGENLVGLSKAVRTAAGVEAGDEVDVTLTLDTAPREVGVPPALAAALAGDPVAAAAYDKLAYTHRKEFARWVAEAKRDDTRDRRIAQALEMLRDGRTRS